MRFKRSSLVVVCVWLALVQGCRQRNDPSVNINLTHEVFPQPPYVGFVTIMLRLTDASGKAVTGAHLKLEANMSHPGMTPVFADANEIEPGRYHSTIKLSMAGDWVILVTSTLPDGRKVERQFEIKGVEPAKSEFHSSGPTRTPTE